MENITLPLPKYQIIYRSSAQAKTDQQNQRNGESTSKDRGLSPPEEHLAASFRLVKTKWKGKAAAPTSFPGNNCHSPLLFSNQLSSTLPQRDSSSVAVWRSFL